MLSKADFESASRLAQVARAFDASVALEMEKSQERFFPLGDPFSIPIHTANGDRAWKELNENGYSDWLAWSLDTACKLSHTPQRLIATLFGQIADVSENDNHPPEILRETPVEKGHDGKTGRTDLQILFPDTWYLIEVKVTSAESADAEKNKGYYESMVDKCHALGKSEKIIRRIFLVTESLKNEVDGWTVLRWKQLAFNLRAVVLSDLTTGHGKATLLQCAALIEQKLLNIGAISHAGLAQISIKPKETKMEERDYYSEMATEYAQADRGLALFRAETTEAIDRVFAAHKERLVKQFNIEQFHGGEIYQESAANYATYISKIPELSQWWCWISRKFYIQEIDGYPYIGLLIADEKYFAITCFAPKNSVVAISGNLLKFFEMRAKTNNLSVSLNHDVSEVHICIELPQQFDIAQFEKALHTLLEKVGALVEEGGGLQKIAMGSHAA